MKPASLTADLLARKGEARPAARGADYQSAHSRPAQPPAETHQARKNGNGKPDITEISFLDIHREARPPEWETDRRKRDYLHTRGPRLRFLRPTPGVLSKLTVRIEAELHKELRLVSACSGRTQQDLANRAIRHVLNEWEQEMGCADQCFCRNAAQQETGND